MDEILPEGFSQLVSLSIEDWDWDILPTRDEQVWDALLYPIFLGATVRSAQANYVKRILDRFITMSTASDARTDSNWSSKLLKRIEQERSRILGTSGESLKRSILELVAQDVADLNLSRTIDTALSFFDGHQVSASLIRSIKDDSNSTKELVDYASREVHNVSYIKAVLWLYGCGIAYDLVPPNAHIIRFLDECGYPGFGWSRNGYPVDWQIFAVACNKMKEVAQQVSQDLRRPVSPKQAQAAVWYLQTCRGLLPRGYAKQLSPRAMISFLQVQGWRIKDLDRILSDIEQLDSLAQDLKDFL